MYKAMFNQSLNRAVIVFYHSSGARILRFGHELRVDGIGLGKVMTWKFGEAAKMYADLLNRGIRL